MALQRGFSSVLLKSGNEKMCTAVGNKMIVLAYSSQPQGPIILILIGTLLWVTLWVTSQLHEYVAHVGHIA